MDNAGKTTILYRLQVGTVVSTIPTIGFNVETVTYKNIKFQVWDLGGQTSIRPYWRCYYPNTQAIIYVVDSSDVERVGTSRQEFHAILEEEELADAVVLVYANKQDLPGALSDAQITEGLGLTEIKDRQWAIFKTSAIKGEGLWGGDGVVEQHPQGQVSPRKPDAPHAVLYHSARAPPARRRFSHRTHHRSNRANAREIPRLARFSRRGATSDLRT